MKKIYKIERKKLKKKESFTLRFIVKMPTELKFYGHVLTTNPPRCVMLRKQAAVYRRVLGVCVACRAACVGVSRLI